MSNEIDGFDGDGNPTTIQLPVLRVVKQALLALDYSQGALENKTAAKQLADQFCLSEIQRTVAREDGAKFWIMQVNGAIQALVNDGKLLRTKAATIITTEAFERMIVEVLEHLDCDTPEVFERRDNAATTTLIEVKTNHLIFGMAFLKPAAGDSETENAHNIYTSYALEILKRAVLEVLYEETDVAPIGVSLYGRGRLLKATEIREQLGLPYPRYAPSSTNALIHGILGYLKDNGYTEHYVGQGWQITNKGISLIEG